MSNHAAGVTEGKKASELSVGYLVIVQPQSHEDTKLKDNIKNNALLGVFVP